MLGCRLQSQIGVLYVEMHDEIFHFEILKKFREFFKLKNII